MRCLLTSSVFLVVVLLTTLPAADPVTRRAKEISLTDLPDFKHYKADPYIGAAVALQGAGKEKAVAILTNLAAKDRSQGEKIIPLCRMLFTAKPKREFRRPALGGPIFVGQTPTSGEWPLEPIEVVDGVPFLVVHGYSVGGYPEPAREYLRYCLRECDWNTRVFKPKTAEEKRRALTKLVASPKWKEPLKEEGKNVLSSQIE